MKGLRVMLCNRGVSFSPGLIVRHFFVCIVLAIRFCVFAPDVNFTYIPEPNPLFLSFCHLITHVRCIPCIQYTNVSFHFFNVKHLFSASNNVLISHVNPEFPYSYTQLSNIRMRHIPPWHRPDALWQHSLDLELQ